MSSLETAPEPEVSKESFDARKMSRKGGVVSKFEDGTGVDSPCAEAAKRSMRCLDLNAYDRDKCLHLFEAYRDCKKAWNEQRRNRRAEGTS